MTTETAEPHGQPSPQTVTFTVDDRLPSEGPAVRRR